MPQKNLLHYTFFIDEEHLLGKGSFGAVYKGINNKTNETVAVKIISKRDKYGNIKDNNSLMEEVHLCQRVTSENIVKIYDVVITLNNIHIILEKCDTDLYEYIMKCPKQRIEEKKAIQILKNICNGFYTLIREGIVHRDLKPTNILMKNGVAKIADFGLAKKGYKDHPMASKCGTETYQAPQFFNGHPISSKCDIWALGVTFYQMLHGKLPWENGIKDVIAKNQSLQLSILSSLSQTTKLFLRNCLKIHEKDRLSWDTLFRDPIFQGYFSNISKEDQQLQNKLGAIMIKLRQQINEKNISIRQLFKKMKFNKDSQISQKQLGELVKFIDPNITSDQVVYIFSKLDLNKDWKISIKELELEMKRNHININPMTPQLKQKLDKSMQNLYELIKYKERSIKSFFNNFDVDKDGVWSFEEFSRFFASFTDKGYFKQDQLESIYRFLDIDRRGSIKYYDIKTYYEKIMNMKVEKIKISNDPLSMPE